MIKEIPGGCMCCVAGLPMQVGLNRLIAEAKPQRILIEPTGLGHPAQIIEALTSPPFDKLLYIAGQPVFNRPAQSAGCALFRA